MRGAAGSVGDLGGAVVLDLTVLLFAGCFSLKSDNICTAVCLLLVTWNENKIVLKGRVNI